MSFSKLRKEFVSTFLEYFSSKGYEVENSYSLIPENDETLLFTNDTIAPWKKYLINNSIPDSGFSLSQPCLRLQGIKDTICEENILETKSERFLGYFNSLGVLANSYSGEKIQEEIVDLLLNIYDIPKSEILVYGLDSMDFLDILKKYLPVTTIPNKEIYYDWKYGLPGIYGRGATFMLKQDHHFKEIGQLIALYDFQKPIGFEFGFGAETFTSRKLKDDSYSSWEISNAVNPDYLRFKTLLDNYSSLGAVLSLPEEKLDNRRLLEKKKLLRNVALIQDLFGLSSSWTEKTLNHFMSLEFNKELNSNFLIELNDEIKLLDYARSGVIYYK